MTKKELKKEISILKSVVGREKNIITSKTAQIRHFRIRLLKIRNSIDYLLKHPFSNDTGNLQPLSHDIDHSLSCVKSLSVK